MSNEKCAMRKKAGAGRHLLFCGGLSRFLGGLSSGGTVIRRRFQRLWGGCFRRCRLDLTSHKPFAPIPPTRARRALFPRWGRGRDFCYLLQGAPPLATPSLYRKACWLTGGQPGTPGARHAGYRKPSGTPCPVRRRHGGAGDSHPKRCLDVSPSRGRGGKPPRKISAKGLTNRPQCGIIIPVPVRV